MRHIRWEYKVNRYLGILHELGFTLDGRLLTCPPTLLSKSVEC